MKISIDGNTAHKTDRSGVGTYTKRLTETLLKSYSKHNYFVVYSDRSYGTKQASRRASVPSKFVNFLRRLHLDVPSEIITRSKVDVAIYPNFLSQPSIFKTKSYAVLHDLSYFENPDYVSDKNQKDLEKFVPATIKRSAGIITVSEISKKKISEHYSYPPEKILVTHIPPDEKLNINKIDVRKVTSKFKINRPYVLFLGNLEPRKNLSTLLDAYEQDARLNTKYSLVLAGGSAWKSDVLKKKISSLKKRGLDIVQCGYVTDYEKSTLYYGASVFTLPSHSEGFGMPILEAMQYKAPVAISDIAVFREVAGNAALYFNQNSPKDIAEKIISAIESTSKLNQQAELQLKKFSWEINAKLIGKFIGISED